MKNQLSVLLFILTLGAQVAFGQIVDADTLSGTKASPERRYSIGVDVFKNLPFLIAGGEINYFFDDYEERTEISNRGMFELIFRKGDAHERYWTGLLGYTGVDIATRGKPDLRSQVRGFYAKIGREWPWGKPDGRSKFGLAGVLTYCSYDNEYVFKGSAFGDYQGRDIINNTGIGLEPYYSFDIALGNGWLLRWQTRVSFHQRLHGKGYTPYYPGVGIALPGYGFVLTGGTTFQLHYRW